MIQKKTVIDSGVGAVESGEMAMLRRRVAELEAELQRLRHASQSVDGALPVREALLHEAEKVAHLGSWFMNPQTNEVKWSEELYRILGYDPAKDTGTAEMFFQAIHPDDLPRALKAMETIQTTGKMVPSDLRAVWKDGTIREIRCDGTVISDEDGKMFRIVGTVLDVTEPRKAQRETNRITRFLKEAQSVANVGSWVWETSSGLIDWSNEMKHIFGLRPEADIDIETFLTMVHPEDRPKLGQYRNLLKADGVGGPIELRIIRTDGSLRNTLVQAKRLDDEAGGPMRFLGTVWDITERKQLEAQLRQSQKMEVVGRVASGVAHDFNNLLTVISGNADLLLEDMPDERLRRIHDAAEVGAALTQQLLSFSRQAVVKKAPMDLNGAVRDIVRIAGRLIGEDVSIKLDLAEKPAVIMADRGQVQQILLNLAVNARDAMAKGGEVTYSTREVPGNPLNVGTEPARWVELKVRDTGKGMDAATRQRALEPFFTTKEPGKGTGLGLSTIADIVAQMKGIIAIASEPNRGTTVTIRLPHCSQSITVQPPAPAKAHKGAESILLVEDNPELRELVNLFLTAAGYKVLSVGRPGEAEALWQSRKDSIDLLITDMVMPGKSGKDLAKALLVHKPELKTLFISGYSPKRSGVGEWDFLQKPFTRNELLDAVRALCDRKAVAGPPLEQGTPAPSVPSPSAPDQVIPAKGGDGKAKK
ncbi:MAG: PAS domain-containing protein [Fibrobacterota bacterium]|nr:PAS domain-containing protein [Fibrobacterota bacterium]